MAPYFTLETGSATEKGPKYSNNQDFAKIDSEAAIFLIADGVGGGPAGDVASRVAVNAAHQYLLTLDSDKEKQPHEQQLAEAIQKAHKALLAVAGQAPAYQGMGTTLSILWLPEGRERAFIGHVGDCHVYLIRQGRVILLTCDHTVLNALREANQLPEDPERWPSRSLLSQVLGSSERIAPQVLSQVVAPGDFFFLCSDGVYDVLSPDLLSSMLNQPHHPQLICEAAVQMAADHGADDNLTAVGVRVKTLAIAQDLLEASIAVTVQGGD